MRGPAEQILYGSNRHKFYAYISLVEVYKPDCYYPLGIPNRCGGGGLGHPHSRRVDCGCRYTHIHAAAIGNGLAEFLSEQFAASAVVWTSIHGIVVTMGSIGLASNLVRFFATVIGSLPLYYLFVWFFVLKKPEQELVRNQVRLTLGTANSLIYLFRYCSKFSI